MTWIPPSDVSHDLQHEFKPDAEQENCKCGHKASKHLGDDNTGRCLGHHMSGGISGMVQQCGCPKYQARSEWLKEVEERERLR